MCTKENKTIQMSLFHFSDKSLLMFPFSVCRSVCLCVLARPASPFQLHVCPVSAWLVLRGFPGRKYVVWSSQVLSSLSITQKLPDEWESNHGSPWQNCLNCIQARIWWGTDEAPVTCNLSYKHVRISSAKMDVLQPPAVEPCLRPVHSHGALQPCNPVSTSTW